MRPTIGSLFTGAGGLDLAVEQVFGATTKWTSDIDSGANKIIAHRFPGVPNLGDITRIDWADVEPVDIITGGWPCQPWSLAGARKGTQDERALWPEVARAVRVLRPRLVVLENVAAVVRAGELERAAGDLAALGYVGSWRRILASDVGAPHGRARIIIAATDPDAPRLQGRDEPLRPIAQGGQRPAADDGRRIPQGRGPAPADDDDEGRERVGRLLTIERDPDRCSRADRVRDTAEPSPWGVYTAAVRRWEHLTRPAPDPTESNTKGGRRLSARFAEWMMGLPDGWICDVTGITRNEALKAAGNGVVPQQAAAALRLMANVWTEQVAA